MRFLQAALVPFLAIILLASAGDDAEAAKGVKKNADKKISGKVVSVKKGKNGQETVTVKAHTKKKNGAVAGAANAANQVAAKGGGKKGKGQTKEFTVDRSTQISNKGGGGKGAVAAGGKGKGKRGGGGGAGAIRQGDHVVATIGANHHATSVEVSHGGKGKGKKKGLVNN